MAGNRLDTRWTKIARTFSRNFNINVQLSGFRCDTNMIDTINIPVNADDMKDADASVLEGLLDHEWKHVEVQRKAQEAGRTTPLDLLKNTTDNKLKQLFNVFEDYRIERELSGELIGCSQNIKAANDHGFVSAKRNRDQIDPFKAIGMGILGRLMGYDVSWLPKEAQAIVEALRPTWSKANSVSDYQQAFDLARDTLKALGDYKEELQQQQEQQAKQQKAQEQKDNKKDSGKGKGKNTPQPDDVEEESGEEESGQGNGGADEEDEGEDVEEESGEEESDAGEDSDSDGDSDEEDEDGEDGPGQGRGVESNDSSDAKSDGKKLTDKSSGGDIDYNHSIEPKDIADFIDEAETTKTTDDLMNATKDELAQKAMDTAKSQHRHLPHPEAVKLDREITPLAVGHDHYKAEFDSVKRNVSALRSKIISLLRSRTHRGAVMDQDSGSLDNGALYRLRTGSKQIFFQPSAKVELDTAVTLLIDCSGSMAGNKIHMARQTALILSEILNQLGIAIEIIGFNALHPRRCGDAKQSGDKKFEEFQKHYEQAHGHYNRYWGLRHYIAKSFNDNYNQAKYRLLGLDNNSSSCNCDNESIMFAAKRLAERTEKRKMLIVLSDGQPNLEWGTDLSLLKSDLNNVIRKVIKAGIELIGIGLDVDYVKQFYPEYAVINDMDKMPAVILNILKKHMIKHI